MANSEILILWKGKGISYLEKVVQKNEQWGKKEEENRKKIANHIKVCLLCNNKKMSLTNWNQLGVYRQKMMVQTNFLATKMLKINTILSSKFLGVISWMFK